MKKVLLLTDVTLVMRKWILLLLLVTGLNAVAKTTYIPAYFNTLVILDNGKVDSVQNYQRILEYDTEDGLVSISILQQYVTPELVKEIKQMKRTEGWASVAAGLSAFSSGYSKGQMYSGRVTGYNVRNYIESRDNMNQSIYLAESANATAESLMELMVDVLIRNNSEKEILINDMERGLTWFVMPKGDVIIPAQKDESMNLRISSVNPLDEKIRYAHFLSTSKMKKYDLKHETDSFWYVNNNLSARKTFHCTDDNNEGYLKIDKETMYTIVISEDELKNIKKEDTGK